MRRHILIAVSLLRLTVAPPCWAQTLWTDASDIRATTGRGDMLFAATGGGLLTWTLPLGQPQVSGTLNGIISNNILGVHLNHAYDELLLRTDNGLARGWPEAAWETLFAQPDGTGRVFTAAISATNGAWIVGGASGELLAWKQSSREWLSIPTNAQVVDLDYSATWGALYALPDSVQARSQQTASLFQPGLLCATDMDGLWLLRSTQPLRWLRIGEMDGLPSEQLLHVVVDDSADVWLATRAGIARLDLQLQVTHWPEDPYLSQRGLTLFSAPSSHVYVGWWGGLFRIVTTPYDDAMRKSDAPTVEPLPGIEEAIVSTSWAQGLWWTGGDSLTSFLGVTLHPPMGVADNRVLSIASRGNEIWMGHPDGHMSRVQIEPGETGLPSHETWQHFSPQDGLPESNLNSLWFHEGTLFVGSEAGLLQQSGLGTGARFQTVVALPPEAVRTQATWRGSHWVGGEAGLWESDGSGWWRIPLWPGASEVQSMCATAETLWVAAGVGGIAARVENQWIEPQREPALVGASFAHLALSTHGIAYCATDAGIVFVENNHAFLLEPPLEQPSPANVHGLLWQDGSLYAGTPAGLFRWQPSGPWQDCRAFAPLPGLDVQVVASGPPGFVMVATTRGSGLVPVEQQPTDASQGESSFSPPSSPSRNVCLVASRQGDWLRIAVPHEEATRMRLFDVRGRYLNEWQLREPGFLSGRSITNNGRRIASGLYLGWIPGPEHKPQTVRILVTP